MSSNWVQVSVALNRPSQMTCEVPLPSPRFCTAHSSHQTLQQGGMRRGEGEKKSTWHGSQSKTLGSLATSKLGPPTLDILVDLYHCLLVVIHFIIFWPEFFQMSVFPKFPVGNMSPRKWDRPHKGTMPLQSSSFCPRGCVMSIQMSAGFSCQSAATSRPSPKGKSYNTAEYTTDDTSFRQDWGRTISMLQPCGPQA